MAQLLLDTLKGNPGDRVPFWFMRQAGRYLPEYRAIRENAKNFLHFCYSPDLAAEVTLQPIRRFDMDGAILFADILLIPDGLGQKVEFIPGRGPVLEALTSEADVDALDPARVLDHVAPVFETVKRVRAGLPPEKTLLGFAGAPWTVATYMVEGEGSRDHGAARLMGYKNPALFKKLLDMLVDSTAAYLNMQLSAGADAVQIFDSWSAAIPEPYFDAWVIEPTKAIVDKVRAEHPDAAIIGFPRLSGSLLEKYAHATGVDALGLDTGVCLTQASEKLGQDFCLQGNLDPYLTIAGGDAMISEAERILQSLKTGPHIFNLGHGFNPATPPEHVAMLSEHIKAFRRG